MVQPKPEAQNTAATYHGAFDYGELRRLGFSPDEVTDFSVNSNPHGPIPGLGNVLAQVPLDRYPDRDCIALREKLAGFHQTTIEHIVCGNGTTELLLLIANAFVRPGDKALILGPTFGEYSRAVELAGGSVATKDVLGSGTPDQSAIGAAVQRIEPRLVFLCHPNNPTGYAWPVGTLVSVAEAHPDVLFVVDEAYIHFAPEAQSVFSGVDLPQNCLVVRSMTKDFALAGLRLGYVLGPPPLIEAVAAMRPTWNVNGFAQAAGLFVLDHMTWLSETVAQLHTDKRALYRALEELGYRPQSSSVHYFLMPVKNSAAFRGVLLPHRVMVRDCTSFGLPHHVRICTRTSDENQKLLDALASVAIE